MNPAETEQQLIVHCCGKHSIHLDEWIREERRGIDLLQLDRSQPG